MCDDAEDEARESLERLHQRAARLACKTVGHRPSKWQTYTYVRLEPKGKKFRWKSCLRCNATVAGEEPEAHHLMDETLMSVYTPEYFEEQTQRSSAIFKFLVR